MEKGFVESLSIERIYGDLGLDKYKFVSDMATELISSKDKKTVLSEKDVEKNLSNRVENTFEEFSNLLTVDGKGTLFIYKLDERVCHFSCNGKCSRARDPFSCAACAHGYTPVKIDRMNWGKFF